MSTNPYQSPETIVSSVTSSEVSRDRLLSIARWQKGVLYCVLGQLLLILLNIALFIAVLGTNPPPGQVNPAAIVQLLASLLFWIVSVASIVCVFGLAIKVYNTAIGVLLGLLSFVPLISLLVLLIVNGRATKTLQKHGVRVGLMGARLSDI